MIRILVLAIFILTTNAYAQWQPTPGMTWDVQYAGKIDPNLKVQVRNIDLEDSSPALIAQLKANGQKVICYFSAGSSEDWRSDFKKFPASVKGKNLDGWAGEKWLDVRNLDVLMPIMEARMDIAVQKGCDAVDPDNVDGYTNKTGFPLKYADQLAYNKALMEAAHTRGLAVSLKNNLDQIKDLLPYFDFAVNEECFAYNECNLLKPVIASGKPVFNIEYEGSEKKFCPKANALNFDSLKKKLSLNATRTACR